MSSKKIKKMSEISERGFFSQWSAILLRIGVALLKRVKEKDSLKEHIISTLQNAHVRIFRIAKVSQYSFVYLQSKLLNVYQHILEVHKFDKRGDFWNTFVLLLRKNLCLSSNCVLNLSYFTTENDNFKFAVV